MTYPSRSVFHLSHNEAWFVVGATATSGLIGAATGYIALRFDVQSESLIALIAALLATTTMVLWQLRTYRRLRQRQWRQDQQHKALQGIAQDNNRALNDKDVCFRHLAANTGAVPYVYDLHTRRFESIELPVGGLLGFDAADWLAEGFWTGRRSGVDLDDPGLIERIVRSGEMGLVFESACESRFGRTVWLRDCCRIGRGGDGRRKIFGQLFDITEAKATGQELAAARRGMAIGRLSAGLIADFSNLLTRLMGNLDEMATSARGDTRLTGLIDDSLAACERGAELNRLLLGFTHPQDVEPRSFQPNRCVATTFALMRRLLIGQIEIRPNLARDLWPAFASPTHVESAMVDLVIDVRESMPHGGVLVVSTRNVVVDAKASGRPGPLPPGCYVCIELAAQVNRLPGAPLASLPPRLMADEAGPDVVQALIGRLNGRLHVEHDTDGTKRVYLPADLSAIIPGAAEGVSSGRKKVLVVDDDAQLRRCAVRQLSALDYQILEAADGPSALAMVERHAGVDVLFTDIVMPGGMSGIDLAEAARRHLPGLKVLMTSGFADVTQANRTRMAGIGGFLCKPYRARDLAREIESVMGG